MQILEGLGITDDTIVARLFRDIRPFGIYDGASEVHRRSITRCVTGRSAVIKTIGGTKARIIAWTDYISTWQ
jgi:hypothetical protein